MQNESEINIKLTESSEVLITTKNKNKITNKNVSIDSLVSAIVSSHKISTGILPRGTRFFSGTASDYQIGIEIPRNVRPLKYVRNGVFDFNIPFPVCFISFHIENCIVKGTRVFSLSNPITSKEDILYGFPFGNTYSDGRVCWGGVSIPQIKSPFELLSLVSLFLNSEYNGDLIGSHSFSSNVEIEVVSRNLISLLKSLDNKDVFPNNLLVPSSFKVKDIMD